MKKVLNLVLVFALTAFFAACNNNNDDLPTTANLTVDLTGLDELGADFVYEGWLIVNGAPVSTGTFTSVSFPQTYTVDINDLESATKFVLSIEPAVDSDPAPAATKILAGDFSGNSASVSSTGIVGDFSNSSGKYILATPTDSDDTNEASGVWFLDNSNPPAVAGLDLPTLSDGWKYEGWVVLNGTPVSTGTFTSVSSADDNAATSPYKGTTGNGPGYPGEDYVMGSAAGVNFPTDLKGATVVISVEPSPDNNPAPFTLKPLAHVVPSDAMNHTVLTMGTGPKAVLTGTVTR
ncbi:anti-sigma factor [Polaribacter pectinis]|uniref:Anti-sigma factor n=1 Tax=Polaribacter pectinis TaxID=2738844 RepID=A0A7G9LCX3_9FLAO|nr:anti-sigma factor [Polaribacter pectinis]QNM86472.1 anti-sigma factor [Polaribacter pectinis]